MCSKESVLSTVLRDVLPTNSSKRDRSGYIQLKATCQVPVFFREIAAMAINEGIMILFRMEKKNPINSMVLHIIREI